MDGSSGGVVAEEGCSGAPAASAAAGGDVDAWLKQVEQQPEQLVVCNGPAAVEQSRQQQQLALALTLQQLDALAAAVAAASSSTTKSRRKHSSRKDEEVNRETPYSSLLLDSAPLSLDLLPGASAAAAAAAGVSPAAASDDFAANSARSNVAAAAATSQMMDALSLQQVWVLVETTARQLLRRLKGKVLQLHAAELRCRKRVKQQRKRLQQQQQRRNQSLAAAAAAAKRRVNRGHSGAEETHVEAASDDIAAAAVFSGTDACEITAAADASVSYEEEVAAHSAVEGKGDETASHFRDGEGGFLWLLRQQPVEDDGQRRNSISSAATDTAAADAAAAADTAASEDEYMGGHSSESEAGVDGEDVSTAALEEEQSLEGEEEKSVEGEEKSIEDEEEAKSLEEEEEEKSLEEGEAEKEDGEEKKEESDDIFFSMEDMQRFVLQEEERENAELSKKRRRSRADGGGVEGRREESSEDEEEEELRDMLYGDGAAVVDGDRRGGRGDNVMFADFFDVPEGMKKKKKKEKKKKRGSTAEQRRDGSDDEIEEEEEEEEEEDAVESQLKEARKQGRKDRDGSSEEEEDVELGGDIFPEGQLDAEERRLQQALDALEAEQEQQHRGRKRRKSARETGTAESSDDGEDEAEKSGIASSTSWSSGEEEAKMSDAAAASDQEDVTAEGSRGAAIGGTDRKHEKSGMKKSSSLTGMLSRTAALEAEILQLEQQLVSKKEWKLRGEVWGRQRPRNALLDVEQLDLPLLASSSAAAAVDLQHLGQEAEDEEEEEETQGESSRRGSSRTGSSSVSQLSEFIERLVKQRIMENLFDDVVRRTTLPPNAQEHRRGGDVTGDATGELDTQQSSVGLGDLYAMEYQRQLAQSQSSNSKRGDGEPQLSEEEKKKAELLELFGKLMYKLDCLSNTSFRPAPAAALRRHGASAAVDEGVAAVQVEEAVPLLMSNANRKAPQELYKPEKKTDNRELTQEERRAQRRSKKEKRRRRITHMIESGVITAAGAQERKMKLEEKNKMQKADRLARKQTGLTQHESIKEIRKNRKRVKFQDLLSDALKATPSKGKRTSSTTSGRRS